MAIPRVGLFGGTFDPIHVGHLALAERAVEQLGLKTLYFVPNAVSPLKTRAPRASGRDRLAMIRAAIKGNPRFKALDLEIRRRGPSFTIDTVAALSRRTSAKLYFLIGADALSDLARWHRAKELARRVTFAVFRRPGSPGIRPPAWVRSWVEVHGPLIDVSSSDLRDRLLRGLSIRYIVPDGAAAVLKRRRLYV